MEPYAAICGPYFFCLSVGSNWIKMYLNNAFHKSVNIKKSRTQTEIHEYPVTYIAFSRLDFKSILFFLQLIPLPTLH